MLTELLTRAHWFKRRDDAIESARANAAALVEMGFSAERVAQCKANWVAKARHRHNIGMGRIPVFENFTLTTNEGTRSGALYAR